PTRAPGFDVDAVAATMWYDKKRAGKTIRFIIPQALGDVVIVDSPGEEVVRRTLAYVLREEKRNDDA
ncbi:MAG: hypothetical protein KDD83_16370, partial [Caldilineaceae bacterium]|nr:hypothetical protein [Caldilineaceae bacterium]